MGRERRILRRICFLAFRFSTDFLLKKKPKPWFFFLKLGLVDLNENKTAYSKSALLWDIDET